MVRYPRTLLASKLHQSARWPGLPTAANPEAVVEVLRGVDRDASVATLTSAARIEAALESASRLIDPFVQIADHIEDGVLPPVAAAARRGASLAQERAVGGFDQVQARV